MGVGGGVVHGYGLWVMGYGLLHSGGARGGFQNFEHRLGEASPIVVCSGELLFAGRGQPVEFGPTVVLGNAPFGDDETLLLEFMEGGVQGALFDLKDVIGALLDPAGDSIAVGGRPGQGLEDHQVERAFEEVE